MSLKSIIYDHLNMFIVQATKIGVDEGSTNFISHHFGILGRPVIIKLFTVVIYVEVHCPTLSSMSSI